MAYNVLKQRAVKTKSNLTKIVNAYPEGLYFKKSDMTMDVIGTQTKKNSHLFVNHVKFKTKVARSMQNE